VRNENENKKLHGVYNYFMYNGFGIAQRLFDGHSIAFRGYTSHSTLFCYLMKMKSGH
jgi:hypothetical protein